MQSAEFGDKLPSHHQWQSSSIAMCYPLTSILHDMLLVQILKGRVREKSLFTSRCDAEHFYCVRGIRGNGQVVVGKGQGLLHKIGGLEHLFVNDRTRSSAIISYLYRTEICRIYHHRTSFE